MRRVSIPQKPKLGDGNLIVVAVNADKNSQHALKWAADHLISKGQSFILLHVRKKVNVFQTPCKQLAFSPAIFCRILQLDNYYNNRKNNTLWQRYHLFACLQCNEVILDSTDVPKAIAEYIEQHSVDKLVLGATSRGALARAFKSADVPTSLSKSAPNFCTVYIISKGKISSVRPAIHSNKTPTMGQQSWKSESPGKSESSGNSFESDRSLFFAFASWFFIITSLVEWVSFISPVLSWLDRISGSQVVVMTSLMVKGMRSMHHADRYPVRSSYENRADEKSNKVSQGGGYLEFSFGSESSGTSPRRSSIDKLLAFSPRENIDFRSRQSRLAMQSGNSYGSPIQSSNDFRVGYFQGDHMDVRSRISGSSMQSKSPYSDDQMRSFDSNRSGGLYWSNGSGSSESVSSVPSNSQQFVRASWSAQSVEDADADMRTVKRELQQIADNVETLNQGEKGADTYTSQGEDYLQNGARYSDISIGSTEEKLWSGKAPETHAIKKMEKSQAGQRQLEGKYLLQKEENRKIIEKLSEVFHYRRYSVEDIEKATNNFSEKLKIGEGGYGPVFKSSLDHTVVAIKILSSDATQGMKQFQQEIEVLSCIRHPNMVLLIGACPEYGCLVYEYMANGSLDDCLFCNNNRPPLSWQLRFKIAAEIATGLLFLHETKPEPLVHRDLKPGNILLDQNFVSKIADVGLARLIPPAAADAITRYKMTATAGTFCYIDPEYQQTGLLGIKSDIYALGIILLQLLTAAPPMGLAHNVEIALEMGRFERMLDPKVPDWPMGEAIKFAKLALSCAELRRRDRPDLGTVMLPQLNHFREFAERSQTQMGNYQCGPTQDNQEVAPSDGYTCAPDGDDGDGGGGGSEDDVIKSPFMR
ncbi:hypothetical protein ACLOJK_001012 [Asimina triloba]